MHHSRFMVGISYQLIRFCSERISHAHFALTLFISASILFMDLVGVKWHYESGSLISSAFG